MKNLGLALFIIGGLISLSLTLKYLPSGLLFMLSLPLFPFFGLYAGANVGDWVPSAWLFGSWILAVFFAAIGNEEKNNDNN